MRYIQAPEIDKEAMLAEFLEVLEKTRSTTGSITYTKKFEVPDMPKANVFFRPEAFIKMRTLVTNCAKEIAWHMTVTRHENTFTVHDIIIYPQVVTGVTVKTDDEGYGKWFCELPDEIFNHLRGQAHSHVNMGVTPSGVDTGYYDQVLGQLSGADYYIFMITNKNGTTWTNIYDFANNLIYEDKDVVVDVVFNDTPSKIWYEQATTVVEEVKVTTSYTPSSTGQSSQNATQYSWWEEQKRKTAQEYERSQGVYNSYERYRY